MFAVFSFIFEETCREKNKYKGDRICVSLIIDRWNFNRWREKNIGRDLHKQSWKPIWEKLQARPGSVTTCRDEKQKNHLKEIWSYLLQQGITKFSEQGREKTCFGDISLQFNEFNGLDQGDRERVAVKELKHCFSTTISTFRSWWDQHYFHNMLFAFFNLNLSSFQILYDM